MDELHSCHLVVLCHWLCVVFYVVLDGFDLGVGILTFFYQKG